MLKGECVSETTLKYYPYLYKRDRNREMSELLFHAKLLQGKILDIGCGDGGQARVLARRGFEVTAVDVNKKIVDIHNSKSNGNPKFLCTGFPDLAVEGPFDLCYALGMSFQFVYTREEFIKAIQRVYSLLKDGGMFIFDMMPADTINPEQFGRRTDRIIVKPKFLLLRASDVQFDGQIFTWKADYHILNRHGYRHIVENTKMRLWKEEDVCGMVSTTQFQVQGIDGELGYDNTMNKTFILQKR